MLAASIEGIGLFLLTKESCCELAAAHTFLKHYHNAYASLHRQKRSRVLLESIAITVVCMLGVGLLQQQDLILLSRAAAQCKYIVCSSDISGSESTSQPYTDTQQQYVLSIPGWEKVDKAGACKLCDRCTARTL